VLRTYHVRSTYVVQAFLSPLFFFFLFACTFSFNLLLLLLLPQPQPQPLRSPLTSHIPFNTVLLSCLCRAIVDVKDSSARWLAGRILRSNGSKPYSTTADPFIPPNLPSRNCYRSYLHDEIVGIEDEIERLHIAFKEGEGEGRGRGKGKGKGKRIAIGKETENDSDSDSGIEIVDEERQEDGVDDAEIDYQSQRNYESEGGVGGGSGGISVDAHSCSEESETAEGTKSHSLTHSQSTSHSHSATRSVTRSQCRSVGQTLSKADEDRSDSILRVKRKFNDVEKASVCNATSKASTAAVKASTSTSSSSTTTSLLATATATAETEAEASISDGSNQMESTTLIPSFCSIADSTSSPKPVDSTPIMGPGSNSEHEQESGIIVPQGLESAGNIGADPGSNSMNTADPPTTASLPASSAYPGLCQIDSDEAFAR
jgi:hypothetical protein